MRLVVVCVFASLLLISAVPAAPAPGAYVGVGSSEGSGKCHQLTTVTLYPSVLVPGAWAADLACAYGPFVNYPSVGSGTRHWPSHVAYNVSGAPETGFFASGTANVRGTSTGTVDWELSIAPLGAATAWSLYLVFHPDPDYLGTGPRHSWWNGTADFVGAHV